MIDVAPGRSMQALRHGIAPSAVAAYLAEGASLTRHASNLGRDPGIAPLAITSLSIDAFGLDVRVHSIDLVRTDSKSRNTKFRCKA